MSNLPYDIKISIILAIVLMVTVVIFLLFIMVLYSRKQVLFEKEKMLQNAEYEKQLLQKEILFQKKSQSEQERISHDLHDDVGSGITALKLQAEFLKKKTTDESIAPNIEELLQTCEELHISMRQILWNLNVGDDYLDNFTKRTIHYAKSFFAKTNIKLHVEKGNIGHNHISADTRRNVFLCLKEALNNVYKHSKCKNVNVNFDQLENIFKIDVKDDGVGLNSTSKFGNGLQNMKVRMATIKGNYHLIPSEQGLHVQFLIDLESEFDDFPM